MRNFLTRLAGNYLKFVDWSHKTGWRLREMRRNVTVAKLVSKGFFLSVLWFGWNSVRSLWVCWRLYKMISWVEVLVIYGRTRFAFMVWLFLILEIGFVKLLLLKRKSYQSKLELWKNDKRWWNFPRELTDNSQNKEVVRPKHSSIYQTSLDQTANWSKSQTMFDQMIFSNS